MSDFLTVPEFADRLGLDRTTVYWAIRQKRVNYVTILGKIGIPKNELKRFKRRRNGKLTKVLKTK